jgi:hypothetical protein
MQTIVDTYESPCKGFVTIGYRNKETNSFSPIYHQKNLVMYGAADIMARLVSGDMRYAVSHMYYHYQNTNSSIIINPISDRSQGADFFRSINAESSGSVTEDWLRIPIITSAKIDKYPNDPSLNQFYKYGNMATFVATSASHPTQMGESSEEYPFGDASETLSGPSKIRGVALVASPNPSDKNQDIVFSRLALTTPITVQANSYIDCFWGLAFK